MTELENKAEEYARETRIKDENTFSSLENECISETQDYEGHSIYFPKRIIKAYKDGYEQGQKDFDTDVTKLLNSYGVTFIDTNSIGGLIGLHQLLLDLEKENEKLKAQIKPLEDRICSLRRKNASLENKVDKMKRCENCKNYNVACMLEEPCENEWNNWELAD